MMNRTITQRAKRTFDAQYVKEQAEGRWLDILEVLCPELKDAIAKHGRAGHTFCPKHGGKHGDAFRLWKDSDVTGACICNSCGNKSDGFETIMWITGWDFSTTLDEVGNWLGLDPANQHLPTHRVRRVKSPEEIAKEKEAEEKEIERIRASHNKAWQSAYFLNDPVAEPARLYGARRGLSQKFMLQTRFLRYHPRMAYYDKEAGKVIGYWPAILALFMGADGKPVTLHRIYITEEGYKAPVGEGKPVKKSMEVAPNTTMSGGCIPLFDLVPNNFLNGLTAIGVTEGIENAFAVIEANDNNIPIWPVTSANLMEKFQVPDIVDVIFIYADWEEPKLVNGIMVQPGIDAARRLKERLTAEGKTVVMWAPAGPSESPSRTVSGEMERVVSWDWLNNYELLGPAGVPDPFDYKEKFVA